MCVPLCQRRLSLAVAVALLAAAPVWAAKVSDAEVLERFQLWLDGTRQLEARFEQTLVSGALGAGLAESGRLYILRPGRMRWDYLEPERKVALVLGERTRLYLEEDRQLWEGTLDASETILPALLASGGRIVELFESGPSVTERRGGDGAYRLSLVPRSDDEAFEEVTVSVRPPDYGIAAVEVLDAAGNRMLYEFSGIRRNEELAAGIFDFEPPEGTEVVARP
jgi:outer membrane lipoprotein carrier protein